MKKGMIFFAMVLSMQVFATTVNGWLQIPKTEVAPVIDGQMDAVWAYAGKERLDTYDELAGLLPDTWLDLWSTVRVMWDDAGFYFYVNVYDDILDNSSPDWYENDGLEFFIDGDNSKNDDYVGYDANDIKLFFVYDGMDEYGTVNSQYAWHETEYGYAFEAFLPSEDLVGWSPEADLDIGIEIQINDSDEGFRAHINRWFSSLNEAWRNPSYFGNAVIRGDDYRTVSNVLDINYIEDIPVIDGQKESLWDKLPNVGMNQYMFINGWNDIQLFAGEQFDLDFHVWQGWNETGYFMYIDVIDDILSVSSPNSYENDGIEFFFDGDNSKNDVSVNYTDGNDVQWRAVLYSETLEIGNGYNAPEHAEIEWVETELGYACELFIPANEMPMTFDEGVIIGYEIQVNDNDGNGIRESAARWWSSSLETWHDPSCMGTAKLVKPGVETPQRKGKLEIVSPTVYDFYGGDGLIQPGEFFRIEFDVYNNTDQTFGEIYALPDSSFDRLVNPLPQYYFDSYLSIDDPPEPGKSSPVDPLDCYVSWRPILGHDIVIPVSFYGDGKWISNDVLRFEIKGEDQTEPFYDYPSMSHTTIEAGQQLVLGVKIFEAGSILNPRVRIKNSVDEIVFTLPLFDDGTHGDTLSQDRVYFTTLFVEKAANFTVDVISEDNSGNIGLAEDYFSFICNEPNETIFNRVASTGNSEIAVIKNVTINQRSLVPGDMVGIFDDTLCVGLGLYQGTFPMSIVIVNEVSLPNEIILPGAKSGNIMTYKVYDNQNHNTYECRANYETGNYLFGNQITVISQLSNDNLVVSIKANRLSWISFHDILGSRDAPSLFNGIQGLKFVMDDVGNHYLPDFDINTLGTIQPMKGYFVYVTGQDQEIYYEGDFLDPETITLDLDASRMHLIGSPCFGSFSVEEVFDSIKDSVVIVQSNAGKYWIPEYNYNTIHAIDFGEAYQIYLKKDVTFTFPDLSSSVSKSKGSIRNTAQTNLTPQYFEYIETGLHLAFVITESKTSLQIGDEIGIFDGDLCVGAAVFDGSFPLIVTAWEGSQDMGLQGFEVGNPITLKIWKQSENQEEILNATFESNESAQFIKTAMLKLILNQSQSNVQTGAFIPDKYALNQNYPNPFNPQTTIQYQLAEASTIDLSIYNMIGQKVCTLANGRQSAGFFEVVWDGRNEMGYRVESGLYLVRFDTEQDHFIRKIMMIK